MIDENAGLKATWQRIEGYLRAHAPDVAATLALAATADQIVAIERAIGRQLPRDLASSLRIHNGQNDPSQLWSFTECGQLLSCEGIVEMWQMTEAAHADEAGRPRPVPGVDYTPSVWWRSTLVPFTFDNGDMLCVDTYSGPDAARGQVVMHVHDDRLSEPLAPSFSAWLAVVAGRLDAGALIVDPQGWSCLRSEI